MPYRYLAGGVAILHLLFVIFVVVGGLFVLRWRPLMWIHLPAAIWGALIEFFSWMCPLTILENWLRTRAGLSRYEEGFIERYILATLYPQGLTRTTQLVLGLIVVVINAGIYWRFFTSGKS